MQHVVGLLKELRDNVEDENGQLCPAEPEAEEELLGCKVLHMRCREERAWEKGKGKEGGEGGG